jgi:hypothetical protein
MSVIQIANDDIQVNVRSFGSRVIMMDRHLDRLVLWKIWVNLQLLLLLDLSVLTLPMASQPNHSLGSARWSRYSGKPRQW